jgi:hypothetical protein
MVYSAACGKLFHEKPKAENLVGLSNKGTINYLSRGQKRPVVGLLL